MNKQFYIVYILMFLMCLFFCHILIERYDNFDARFKAQERTNMVLSKRLNQIPGTAYKE